MPQSLKTMITCVAGLALSTAASATCLNSHYCTSNQLMTAPMTEFSKTAHYVTTSNHQSSSLQTYGFSGSPASLPGLGHNESLRARTCPTTVHNPDGGTVLGCYDVVKPVPQTTYYRVVRPIIYVRYAVPIAVPYYQHASCQSNNNNSRYGATHYGYKRHCR